jgi:hypothetical protein
VSCLCSIAPRGCLASWVPCLASRSASILAHKFFHLNWRCYILALLLLCFIIPSFVLYHVGWRC